MKKFSLLIAIILTTSLYAQVGISTTNPQAGLDVNTTNAGVLIPRVGLSGATDATTVSIPGGTGVAVSTLVYNDGTGALQPAGFYFWDGAQWVKFTTEEVPRVYTGKFLITLNGTGTLNVTGLPFEPKSITFSAYANVETENLDADNGVGNNNSGIANAYGSMSGYAQNNSGTIDQQVIYVGGSGNSINDISRYASSLRCIGVRYSNQNGDALGRTTAALTSFNPDGFTLNVNNAADGLLVLYTAYR